MTHDQEIQLKLLSEIETHFKNIYKKVSRKYANWDHYEKRSDKLYEFTVDMLKQSQESILSNLNSEK